MSHFSSELLSRQCVDWTGPGSGVQNTYCDHNHGPRRAPDHRGVCLCREGRPPLQGFQGTDDNCHRRRCEAHRLNIVNDVRRYFDDIVDDVERIV